MVIFFFIAIDKITQAFKNYFEDRKSIKFLKGHFLSLHEKYQSNKTSPVHYCRRDGKIVRII